jgi:hypothetical protein
MYECVLIWHHKFIFRFSERYHNKNGLFYKDGRYTKLQGRDGLGHIARVDYEKFVHNFSRETKGKRLRGRIGVGGKVVLK